MTQPKNRRELFQKAVEFYANSPTGQYDEEATQALDCFFEMLDALTTVQECEAFAKLPDRVQTLVSTAIANAHVID